MTNDNRLTPDAVAEQRPWERLPDETPKAYAAFRYYYPLPPHQRSVLAAFRAWNDADNAHRKRRGQPTVGRRTLMAPGNWNDWAAKYDWVSRALAHDEHVADVEEAEWLERRRQLRIRDWEQGDRLRAIVDDGLAEARQFVRRQIVDFPAEGDQPARQIITLTFDVSALTRVAVEASKLQRLAANEPTDNIRWSGAILDRLIEAELARVANGDETGAPGPASPDEIAPDEMAETGD